MNAQLGRHRRVFVLSKSMFGGRGANKFFTLRGSHAVCGVAVYCHHLVLCVITGWIRKRKCLFRHVGASEERDSLES